MLDHFIINIERIERQGDVLIDLHLDSAIEVRCFFGWDHESARVGAASRHANHHVVATEVANQMFVDERAEALGQVGIIGVVEGRLDFLGVKVKRTIA